ncbi:AGAP011989-PA-like protein [Anopheles sinensis]|uniref:AGAP011989-PA-like protein n=1 Tax=Anopheles sinensis TaxID=74873 RepID=A0A084W4D6_ANOSI|nr:AGAP011989-PA-like protein [Anopheles sinensis]
MSSERRWKDTFRVDFSAWASKPTREEVIILISKMIMAKECVVRTHLSQVNQTVYVQMSSLEQAQEVVERCRGKHGKKINGKLTSIINLIAFVQYYSTYLIIADCCLILATEELSSYSIVYVVSMMVFLTEAYLLCQAVEHLRNLKPRIAATLYGFDWMLQLRKTDERNDAEYRHTRRTFLLLTAHSGQMIHFSFAGIGEISMHSFWELLEKSYSMLTFLLQFAK